MKTAFLILVVFINSHIMSFSQVGEGRRYVALSRDLVEVELSLLARNEVQQDLKLSRSQIDMLGAVTTCSLDHATFVQVIRNEYDNKLSDPSLSANERKMVISEKNKRFAAGTAKYLRDEVNTILTKSQKRRLMQLVVQANGPAEIVSNTELAHKLQITDEQQSRLATLCSFYEKNVQCYYDRLLQLQMSDVRQRPSAEIEKEVASLYVVIEELERDKDYQLISILTDDQRKRLDILKGRILMKGPGKGSEYQLLVK